MGSAWRGWLGPIQAPAWNICEKGTIKGLGLPHNGSLLLDHTALFFGVCGMFFRGLFRDGR